MKIITSLRFLFATMFLFGACALASAATITWTNTTGGDWSVAANWNPNQVPGTSDNAIIANAGTYAVNLDTTATVAGFTLGASSSTSTQSFSMNGRTFTLNGPGTVTSRGVLNFNGGTLNGTGTLAVDGACNWSGGYISGPGGLMIDAGGTMVMSGSGEKDVLTGRVVNAGTVTWTDGPILLWNQGVFTNLVGAVFDAQTDNYLYSYETGPNVFYNWGTFRKSAGAGTTTITSGFVNRGIMDAQTGTIVFNNANSDPVVFNSGSSFTGAGTTYLSNGKFTMNGSINSSNLVIAGGTVTGTYAVTGTLTFSSGYMDGPGVVTIATNGTLLVNAPLYFEARGTNVIVNAGTVTWTSGDFFLEKQSVFTNLAGAVFDAQTDNVLYSYDAGPNVFYNLGTFRKSAGAGTTTITSGFVNSGIMDAQTGTVVFNNANSDPVVFNSGSSFTGAGTTYLSAGKFTINGSINSSNLVIAGGTVTGTYAVAGTLTFSSGYMNGPGVVTIAPNGTLALATTTDKAFHGNTIVNAGTVTWIGGDFYLGYRSVFTNLAGAVFDAQTDKTLFSYEAGTNASGNVFYNSGIFRKTAGLGTNTVSCDFTNTGTVSAQSGTLAFSASFANPVGTLVVSGGSKVQFAQPLVLPAGLVTGSGTVQAPSITSSAVVSPGATNAVLTLSGSYTQLYSGSIQFDIGGTLPGMNQSQVNVTGPAKVDGQIELRFSPGYSPAVGSSNVVLTASPLMGKFCCFDHFFLLGQNKHMVAAYTPTNVTLTTVSAPDPSGPSLGQSLHEKFLVCWPSEFTNFGLYFKTNLSSPLWTPIPGVTNHYLENPLSAPRKFFILIK